MTALEVGTELPPRTFQTTRTDLVRYAGASGDFNPIHYSDFFANRLGLPGVVGQGMRTQGLVIRYLTDYGIDPGAISSFNARFSNPLPVPDNDVGVEITISGRVTSINDDGDFVVEFKVTMGETKILLGAKATVRPDLPETA